jgi:hypothetical protein
MPRAAERRNFTLPMKKAGGIGLRMRLPLLLLAMAACPVGAQARASFHWPWSRTAEQKVQQAEQKKMRLFPLFQTSRSREQQRLNAATAPKATTREEQVMKPDLTREFNPGTANFGSGRTLTGKPTATNTFQVLNKTRTKSFDTGAFTTKQASGSDSKFATKDMPTKKSLFSRLTAPTKTFATRESRDAGRGLQGATLPGSEKKFLAIGRRQAEMDRSGASIQPMGGDRDSGQSWSGDIRPMSIQDVKSLLNKN